MKDSKAKKARSVTARLTGWGISKGIPTDLANKVVQATLVPTMDWGAGIWRMGDTWEQGQTVMNNLGRKILKVAPDFPNLATQGELGWHTIEGRAAVQVMILRRRLKKSHSHLVQEILTISENQAKTGKGYVNWSRQFREMVAQRTNSNLCTNKIAVESEIESLTLSKNKQMRTWVHNQEEILWQQKVQESKSLPKYGERAVGLRLAPHLRKQPTASSMIGNNLVTYARADCLRLGLEVRGWGTPKKNTSCGLCLGTHSENHIWETCKNQEIKNLVENTKQKHSFVGSWDDLLRAPSETARSILREIKAGLNDMYTT